MADWIVLHPKAPKWPDATILINLDQVLIISPLGEDSSPGSQLLFEGGRELLVHEHPRQIIRMPRTTS